MSVVIQVDRLSKQYRLGTIGHGRLADDLNRWWAKLRGKEDPLSKVDMAKPESRKQKTENKSDGNQNKFPLSTVPISALRDDTFWALRDVSFEVKQGEVLGIIGRNGAGKSTLLKILSRVTGPTSGELKVRGRIASLLEVGTGFHPELTGRENVFLNGAILGMTKAEIRKKFDEIVDFSGIEQFIDTPVKRYSSGMYVRLAFAVAAHLEPEILVIDEVLAVGDAEFQKKCVGKMHDVSRGGRTVLFVSHNLTVVSSLCGRAMLLEAGKKTLEGRADEVINGYIKSNASSDAEVVWEHSNPNTNNGRLRLAAARVLCDGKATQDVVISKPVIIQYDFEVLVDDLNVCTSIHLSDKHGTCVLASGTSSTVLKRGIHQHSCILPDNLLNDVFYSVKIILLTDVTKWEVSVADALTFVAHETTSRDEYLGGIIGCVRPKLEWQKISLNGARQ